MKLLKNVEVPKVEGYWIIHTGRPFYKLFDMTKDRDTALLLKAREKGEEQEHPLAKPFRVKDFPAENISYSPKRVQDCLYAEADEFGDFHTTDPMQARTIWEAIKNDPPVDTKDGRKGVTPYLDQICHPIPEFKDLTKPTK